jgi:hypothetical protein
MRQDLFKDAGTGGKLHLFSIYTDFGAYGHIKWITGSIAKLAGHRWQCSSEAWKLDPVLTTQSIGRMLAEDGANADALVVVVNSLEHSKPGLIEWLDSLAPLNPHRSGLLIGLLGGEENNEEELDRLAKQLIQCAQKTNRKFIWHWLGHHDTEDSDWLAEGVETLLARKQLMPERVIFQASPTDVSGIRNASLSADNWR